MEVSFNKFRLSRLNIFLVDFRQAHTFATYILKKKLHDVKGERAKSKLVHLAFNTSLIVSYSRPFHKSNERDGLSRVWLRDATNEVLSDTEKSLHTKILKLRDQTFAHSDAVAHEIPGFDYSGKSVQFYKLAFAPLSKDETRTLKTILMKWIDYLEIERSVLKQTLLR